MKGGLAVAKNCADFRMLFEKRGEVIDLRLAQAGVERTFPSATPDDVPKRDAVFQQDLLFFFITFPEALTQQMAHDPPKLVARVAVIFLDPQGRNAGHGTEDKDGGGFVDDGREAGDFGRRSFGHFRA